MRDNAPTLFNTYQFVRSSTDKSVRCCGCKELFHPGLDAPAHIVGLIEFDGNAIPVIDPALQLCNEPTPLTSAACILVVQHLVPGRLLHTGIVIAHSQEILELASGSFDSGPLPTCTTNMLFVLDIRGNMHAALLLAENHRIMTSALRPTASTGERTAQPRHAAAI
jgi:hypothetical protein